MFYHSASRGESPSHQRLFRRSGGNNGNSPRPRNGITTSRDCYAVAVTAPARGKTGTARRRGGGGVAASFRPRENRVFVADVNPAYSISAAVRCMTAVNDRVMWTAEFDGGICVRALPTGTPLRQLPGRDGTYGSSMLYVTSTDTVWVGFQDGYLHIYNARTMELVMEVMAHNGGLGCMTTVDHTVFTGGADWKVCEWNSQESGAAWQVRSLGGHRGNVRSLAAYDGPTGSVLFSGSDDGTIRAWDPYSPKSGGSRGDACLHIFHGHERAVLSLTVIPHVTQLWSGGEDTTVRVWDMQSLDCIDILSGCHMAPVSCITVVESRVWSADKQGHIFLWDLTTRTLLQDIAERVPFWGLRQGMVLAITKLQPTTAYKVWTATSNGVLQCWNAETSPILFDGVPIAADIMQQTEANPRRSAPPTSARQRTGDGAFSSALTVSSARSDVSGQGRGLTPSRSPSPGIVPHLQDLVNSLQQELQAAQRDGQLSFDKYRAEVQREVETQQLLSQENAALRNRVSELEVMVAAMKATPREGVSESLGGRLTSPSPAHAEAMQEEIDDLQRRLDEATRQLAKASPSNASGESNRRFGRQEAGTTLPSVPEDALSIGSVAVSDEPYSALLPEHRSRQGKEGTVARTVLRRTIEGQDWAYLVSEKPHELRTTLEADLCAGLGVAPTQLDRVSTSDMENGALEAEVDVAHPSTVSKEELRRRMREYTFPGLAKMHAKAHTAPKTDADAAAATIAALEAELQQREADDSEQEMNLRNARPMYGGADEGHTTAEFKDLQRRLDEANKKVVDVESEMKRLDEELRSERQKLAAGTTLPSVPEDALSIGSVAVSDEPYSALLPEHRSRQGKEGTVARTVLRRTIEGQDWAYLVSEKPHELRTTLEADLCAGLGVAPTQLERVSTSDMENGALEAEVDVAHPSTVSKEELRRRMREYTFPGLAKMHAKAHTAPKTDADAAAATIAALEAELQQREADDSEQEMNLRNARPMYGGADEGHTTVEFKDLQRRLDEANKKVVDVESEMKRLDEELRSERQKLAAGTTLPSVPEDALSIGSVAVSDEPYSALLPEHRSRQGKEGTVARTVLRRTIEGQDWAYLVSEKPHELRTTLEADLCAGLGVAPTQLDRVSTSDMENGALEAEVDVAHPSTVSKEELRRRMREYTFPGLAKMHAKAHTAPKTDADAAAATIAALEAELQQREADDSEQEMNLRNARPMYGGADEGHTTAEFKDLQRRLDEANKKVVDVESEMKRLDEELRSERQKLAAAAVASPHAMSGSQWTHGGTEREDSAEQKLRHVEEDHNALKTYVQEQLKPLISRLKRFRGELELDKSRLLERLGLAEMPTSPVAAHVSSAAGSPGSMAMSSPRKSCATNDYVLTPAQLEEEFTALNTYVHEQLKPMISALKRAKGELQFDLSRTQDDLREACDLYEEASAALEEAQMRDEKTAEAMEALQKALEEEQQQHEATRRIPAPTMKEEEKEDVTVIRSPRARNLHGIDDPQADNDDAEVQHGRGDSVRSDVPGEKPNVALDRLIAQNLDLSVRLTDAEMVAVRLQHTLDASATRLSRALGPMALETRPANVRPSSSNNIV